MQLQFAQMLSLLMTEKGQSLGPEQGRRAECVSLHEMKILQRLHSGEVLGKITQQRAKVRALAGWLCWLDYCPVHLGHTPRFRVGYLVGACMGGNGLMSLSLSQSLPCPLSKIN